MVGMALPRVRKSSDRRRVRGFDVFFLPMGPSAESLLPPITGALDLIAATAPWIIARAKRDSPEIFVPPAGGSGSVPIAKAIRVPATVLSRLPTSFLAANMVYDFTVVRLGGNRFWGNPNSLRTMRAAFERQMAFARRLPDGLELVQELTRGWDLGWYTPGQERANRARNLEVSGLPTWIVRIGKRLMP
jgi:hypothetical protein